MSRNKKILFGRLIGIDVFGEFEFEVRTGGFRAAEGQGGAAEFGDDVVRSGKSARASGVISSPTETFRRVPIRRTDSRKRRAIRSA